MFSCILRPYSRLDAKSPTLFQTCYSPAQFIFVLVSCLNDKWHPILNQNSLISIPYPRLNCTKTLPFTATQTYIPYIWEYPLPRARGIKTLRASFKSMWSCTRKPIMCEVPHKLNTIYLELKACLKSVQETRHRLRIDHVNNHLTFFSLLLWVRLSPTTTETWLN